MHEARNQTTAKPRTRTAAAKTSADDSAKAEAEKPTAKSAPTTAPKTAPKNDESGNRLTVTIPLDGALVGTAVKAATLPLTAARKVAKNKNGLPAYAAVGGLAVLGAVEWPVAAAGGLGLAVLRRWGPLKPADQDAKKSA